MSAKRPSPKMSRDRVRKSWLALLESRKGAGISDGEADALAAEARRWARRGPGKRPKPGN